MIGLAGVQEGVSKTGIGICFEKRRKSSMIKYLENSNDKIFGKFKLTSLVYFFILDVGQVDNQSPKKNHWKCIFGWIAGEIGVEGKFLGYQKGIRDKQ